MRLAASTVYLVATTLFCLTFLLETSHAVVVTSVVAANGDAVIHPNALIKISWTAEAGDPSSFDINLHWPEGGLMLLRANINLKDGSATVSVRDVPAPETCTIAMSVNGRPVNTKSVSFTVEPEQPSSTELPPPGTNAQGSSTNSPTTPQGSPTYPAVGTTTTATEPISAPTIVMNTGSPSAFPSGYGNTNPSATNSASGKLITTISTDGGGHIVTSFINPTPTSTSSGTAQSEAGDAKKSSAGAVVGGVIGGLAALAFIVAAVVWYVRRRRRRMAPSQMFRWLSGPDRELYESEMRQRARAVNRAPDESNVNPPPAYSNINAWLGKIRPPDREIL